MGTREIIETRGDTVSEERSSKLEGSLRKLNYLKTLTLNHPVTNGRKKWYVFLHPNDTLILRTIEFRARRGFSRRLVCLYEFAFILFSILS